MTVNNRLPYDIVAVGLGIVGTHQITREVEETIRRSKQTFVIDTGVGVMPYLRTLCPKVTNLMAGYPVGTHRRLIYRKMASTVVAAAMEDPPVCFAAYGHPKLYCHPTTLIQRAARVLNLKVQVLPGVSSLDTLLVDLNIDPGFDGLQVYDATDLVVRRRPLQTDVSCVILQGPIVLEPFSAPGSPSTENLKLLQNYLLEFYPAHHDAVMVITRTHPLLKTVKQKIPLGKLASALLQSSNLGTLYIPPVSHREVAEQELADRIKVPASGASKPNPRPGRPVIGPRPA